MGITVGAWQNSMLKRFHHVSAADAKHGYRYGFRNVVTPGDILMANSAIWPFSKNFSDYYKTFARPLPKPIDLNDPLKSLKIDAVFVFNDPRDWALDTQV